MPLNAKQELFVREYLVDMSPADAYLRAGYEVASREVAWKAANRLMKNVEVLRAIDDAQCERMDRLDLTADWVVARFHREYLEASRDRNHSAAIKALENIARYLGIYERDPRQKYVSPEDVERIKSELEARGVSFERVNAPPHLKHPAPLSAVNPIVVDDTTWGTS